MFALVSDEISFAVCCWTKLVVFRAPPYNVQFTPQKMVAAANDNTLMVLVDGSLNCESAEVFC